MASWQQRNRTCNRIAKVSHPGTRGGGSSSTRARNHALVWPLARNKASWGPKAIVVTLTIANPTSAGFATVYACDDPPPPTSTIKFLAGETRAATTIVSTPASPTLCVTTSTAADVIVVDVAQVA